jgi:hypothetical protein
MPRRARADDCQGTCCACFLPRQWSGSRGPARHHEGPGQSRGLSQEPVLFRQDTADLGRQHHGPGLDVVRARRHPQRGLHTSAPAGPQQARDREGRHPARPPGFVTSGVSPVFSTEAKPIGEVSQPSLLPALLTSSCRAKGAEGTRSRDISQPRSAAEACHGPACLAVTLLREISPFATLSRNDEEEAERSVEVTGVAVGLLSCRSVPFESLRAGSGRCRSSGTRSRDISQQSKTGPVPALLRGSLPSLLRLSAVGWNLSAFTPCPLLRPPDTFLSELALTRCAGGR